MAAVADDTHAAHRFPVPATPLLGRDEAVRAVAALLAEPGVRLVTLTGPGGVGKTRLAVAAAAAAEPNRADGAAFVALAPVRDPDLVLPAVADALGIRGGGLAGVADRVRAHQKDRPLLLVLDNLEHLLDATPAIAGLLAACPGVRMLATSREPLRLSAERVVPVDPLPLPPDDELAPATLAANPAVALLVARARAADPAFALSAANAADVAAIVRRLDGLPLAIELAAARVRVLPPAALLPRLEASLRLLTGGPRDAPARQRTMRDAVAWSVALLSASEQALFRRLAVFVGGFAVEAAERVAGNAADGLDGVTALIDKGLLRRQAGDGAEPRFAMLEPVREFARERLEASGESAEAHEALLDWLLDRSAVRHRRWLPAAATEVHDRDWFAYWERELPNVRAALAWAEARGDAERMLRLADDLMMVWWSGRHLEEGWGWLERGLASPNRATPGTRARALGSLGALAHRRDDASRAEEFALRSRALSEETGDEAGTGYADYLLGLVAYRRGNFAAADRCYAAALARLQTAGNDSAAGDVLVGLAQVAQATGDLARAAVAFDAALDGQRGIQGAWGRAVACYGCATVAHARGRIGVALARYREGLAFWHDIGDEGSVAVCLEGIAAAVATLGDGQRAAVLLGAAQRQRELANAPMPDRVLGSFGRVVAGVHACLGPAAFCVAWLDGRALSRAAAVAAACRDDAAQRNDRPPVPHSPRTPGDRFGLSPREREVLRLVTAGKTDQQIADGLFVSRRTVTTHTSNLFAKLGVANRTEAAALAAREGLA